MKIITLIFFFHCLLPGNTNADNQIHENFNSIALWKPLTFPKIKIHSRYTIIKDRKGSYLKAIADNSASALIYKREFNVYETPVLSWRWKISNVYEKGNGKIKSREDYPVRIYIMFKYNPSKAGTFEKLKYNAVKLIYGKYPPHSSLSYVWANKTHKENIITSPYSEKAKIILIEKGNKNIGNWVVKKADILRDYKKAFGENPPEIAGIAVMSDADNTGEKATAFIDYIKISKK